MTKTFKMGCLLTILITSFVTKKTFSYDYNSLNRAHKISQAQKCGKILKKKDTEWTLEDLTYANLKCFNLSGIDFLSTNFKEANVENTNFNNAIFEKTSFPKANLEKATFINAKFKNYFSSENPFKSANVKNTNFFCAHGLSNKVKKYLVKHGAINVPLEIEYNSKNFKNEIKRKRKKQILPKILIQLLKNQKKTKKLQLGQFTQTINL